MEPERLFAEIERFKETLGADLVILVHHYQRDDVIRFADYRGDSLELSRVAAAQRQARYIVFCGVNFMAETAAVLCDPSQTVVQPAGNAPCPMARMANVDEAQEAWDLLSREWDTDLLPITYQNSDAALKAFCGRRGGAVCTSSNAERLFRWALNQHGHLLFFPDRWLGTNTALAMGIPAGQIAVWKPDAPEESLEQARRARVVVWNGYCNVHVGFTVEHVQSVRAQYPGIRVVVHPECPTDVVAASDANGSTSFIIQYVSEAPAGSTIAVGTEINLVSRLAQEYAGKQVIPLARSLCGAMYRTNPLNLRDALASCVQGDPIHVIRVDPQTAQWANVALERMLTI